MSTTNEKRLLAVAKADAEEFRSLFPGCSERWEIAGSVRREREQVGDIEHVVHAASGPIDDGGLFGQKIIGNMLWSKLDDLVAQGIIAKAIYPDGKTRYGDRMRGVIFKGFRHEIFRADRDNWGCILAIRTGPAEFSQQMVTRLQSTRLIQDKGYLRYRDSGMIFSCPTEEAFFKACQTPWQEPHQRGARGTERL